jgi:hypothetical protein
VAWVLVGVIHLGDSLDYSDREDLLLLSMLFSIVGGGIGATISTVAGWL